MSRARVAGDVSEVGEDASEVWSNNDGGPRLLRGVEQLEEVGERLLMLSLVFEDEAEDVALAEQRVWRVEVRLFEAAERALAHAREVGFHLAPRGQVSRLFARRLDGVEDALVVFVGRRLAAQFLQQPVSLEDADVREVPDDGAEAEAGAFAQVLFARRVEKLDGRGAHLRHLARDLFGLFFHQSDSARAAARVTKKRRRRTWIVRHDALSWQARRTKGGRGEPGRGRRRRRVFSGAARAAAALKKSEVTKET